MKSKISFLACTAIFLCASLGASAQGVRKRNPTIPKKAGDKSGAQPNTDKTVLPDLSVTGTEPFCLNHQAKVRVDRFGSSLANSFYVSLKIYKGTTVIESMEQLVAPFSNSYQEIYFTTQTNLLRMEASEQLSCQFTADSHHQVREINESNNVINETAPLNGYGPHD
jgi:hypothetical protein